MKLFIVEENKKQKKNNNDMSLSRTLSTKTLTQKTPFVDIYGNT